MKSQTQRKPTHHLKTQTKKPNKPVIQTFADHIGELRRRLFWIGAFLLAGSTLAYSQQHIILDIIMRPLNGEKLVYLTPGGGFSFIFQISLYSGALVALPVAIYQLYSFIRPALPKETLQSIVSITVLSIGLMLTGAVYGYYIAIPAALEFLTTFAEGAITPNLTADSYLQFFLAYTIGLAIASLVPVFLLLWHSIRPLQIKHLIKSERWIILGAFIIAAIITPTPDAVNQVMIAGPIIGIYQLGVILVLINIHKSKSNHSSFQKSEN